MALTDTDYLEVHLIVEMLADNPGDRRLQEAAWKLVHRLRDQGKIPVTERLLQGHFEE